jgi:hypothetical protein
MLKVIVTHEKDREGATLLAARIHRLLNASGYSAVMNTPKCLLGFSDDGRNDGRMVEVIDTSFNEVKAFGGLLSRT